MACYGMVTLASQGIKIDLVLPTKELVYFPLREEVILIPFLPCLLNREHKEYIKRTFSTLHERLEYIGASTHRKVILTSEIKDYVSSIKKTFWLTETVTTEEHNIWKEMTTHLIGGEDLIRKVQEYTLRAVVLPKFWIMT